MEKNKDGLETVNQPHFFLDPNSLPRSLTIALSHSDHSSAHHTQSPALTVITHLLNHLLFTWKLVHSVYHSFHLLACSTYLPSGSPIHYLPRSLCHSFIVWLCVPGLRTGEGRRFSWFPAQCLCEVQLEVTNHGGAVILRHLDPYDQSSVSCQGEDKQ